MKKERTTTWEILGIRVNHLPLTGKGNNEGVHASDIKNAELQIAHLIIQEGYPLCGEEVRFLRKLLGLSLEKFAANFGLTGSGVRKWEEEKKRVPLDIITQISLRVFFTHKFNLPLQGNFNTLRGLEKKPGNVEVDYERSYFNEIISKSDPKSA